MLNVKANQTISYEDIVFQRFWVHRKCGHELDVNLVIANFALNTSHMCHILKELDNYLWRSCILHILGIQCLHAPKRGPKGGGGSVYGFTKKIKPIYGLRR